MEILLLSGEQSGFKHLSQIARVFKNRYENITISAMGYLCEYIDNLVVDIGDKSEIGFAEILRNIGFYIKSLAELKSYLRNNRPDIVISIDNFEFNMLLLEDAFKFSKNLYYFIPPKVWAWGGFRINILKRYCKKVYTIFNFESDFLRKSGVNAEYIGNPFFSLYKDIRNRFDREERRMTVGLLPGSRQTEIRNHLPVILETVKELRRSIKETHFVLGCADKVKDLIMEMTNGEDIEIADGIKPVIERSAVVIVASGTATFETAICGIPMAIIYRTSPITYLLGRFLLKIKNIGLPNIIAKREIVPEFVQNKLKPERLSKFIIRILNEVRLYKNMRTELLKSTDETITGENYIYMNLVDDITKDTGLLYE
jgi:lipid-A-disaccharide synthase